jgi:DNA-binding transcriptional MocR family regulator
MQRELPLDFLRMAVSRSGGPLYLGIADAIGLAIARHTLNAGDRLPTQRRLAAVLDVDLTTVTRAYAEAQRRGLLDAQVGRGTFVRAAATSGRSAAGSAMIDMGMNLPPQPERPSLRALLETGLAALLREADPHSLMAYRTGAGSPRDRAAAAAWLAPVAGELDPERILVCGGAQAALTALMTTLARPGDTILTEPLTYPGFRALAAQLELRLVAAAADDQGLLPDAVEHALAAVAPKAIYCVPTIHNPTAVTMSPERRQALATLARRHAVPIVEDEAYGLLPSRTLPSVTAGTGAGYAVVTLSKCLSPGLRTAFVVAPGRAEAVRLTEAIRAVSLGPPALLTELVTGWIETGTAAALRDAVRQESAARQVIAREVLAGATMAAHPEGLHVWLTLPDGWERAAFVAQMRERGLALVASDRFAVAAPVPNAVRVCLGVAESQVALRVALVALGETLRSEAPTQLAAIV